jgi:hypothetical protein
MVAPLYTTWDNMFCIIDVTNKVTCNLLSSVITQNNTNRYISRICFYVISEKHTGNAEVFLYDSSFNNCLNTFESSMKNIACIFSNTQRQRMHEQLNPVQAKIDVRYT